MKTDTFGGKPGRLVSVPIDEDTHVRAEVCFGQRAGALWFTLFCDPVQLEKRERRFGVGERVVCAVEGETDPTTWAAGAVVATNYCVKEDAQALHPELADVSVCVPYRIQLDSGCTVLAHRDEHWLVRDLALQAEKPRQAADGTRCLARLEKRPRDADGAWEVVDHETRQVRPCAAPEPGDEDSD